MSELEKEPQKKSFPKITIVDFLGGKRVSINDGEIGAAGRTVEDALYVLGVVTGDKALRDKYLPNMSQHKTGNGEPQKRSEHVD